MAKEETSCPSRSPSQQDTPTEDSPGTSRTETPSTPSPTPTWIGIDPGISSGDSLTVVARRSMPSLAEIDRLDVSNRLTRVEEALRRSSSFPSSRGDSFITRPEAPDSWISEDSPWIPDDEVLAIPVSRHHFQVAINDREMAAAQRMGRDIQAAAMDRLVHSVAREVADRQERLVDLEIHEERSAMAMQTVLTATAGTVPADDPEPDFRAQYLSDPPIRGWKEYLDRQERERAIANVAAYSGISAGRDDLLDALGAAYGTIMRPRARPSIYTPEAKARAEKMLLRYLAPAQAESYRAHGMFVVNGGATGRRYRIRKAAIVNVDDLDRRRRLCLVFPGVPLCDQLAGQKMLIEADEPQFLKTAIDQGRMAA